MNNGILRCLKIRGLKESELVSALEVFGAQRLQVSRTIIVDWDPLISQHRTFWSILNASFPAVQHVIMHGDPKSRPQVVRGRIPMIIPSPTQPLESLDMHVYLNYATMLRALPAAEHPEVRHLVLRLNSHNDDFVASAGRDALNKAIRHYRGVRTLSIIVHSSQLIVKRNDHQSRGSSFLTSLRAADLPDLEALILESSHPICFFGDLQKVLAYAIQLASSPTAAYAKLQFIKIAITEDMCGVVSEDRRAPARIGEAETQRARQILRQELAEIDSVTLKLAHCIPLLTFVEIEIVRRTPCLKKSIFRYTSDVHAARGPGDNSSGKLELTEETARSLIANSDGPHGRALSSSP